MNPTSLGIFQVLFCIIFQSQSKQVSLGSSENIRLSIIHFNDFHARFEETDSGGDVCKNKSECIGGYSRLYNQINKMKTANSEYIVLNAGDVAYGTFWYTIGSWNISQNFMNKLPIDAEVLGNHEFDYSIEGVVNYIKALKHPVVVSNINHSLEPTLDGIYTKSHIVERNGKKIGIIGLVASDFDKLSKTGKVLFLDESSCVNAEAERLVRDKEVFTNIIVSHAGYDVDKKVAGNASEKISLIVGGHSHSLLSSEGSLSIPDEVMGPYPTLVTSKFGHKVAIVQAAAYSRILGNITVFINKNGELDGFSGKPILLDQRILQDNKINEELLKWKQIIESQKNPVIGTTTIKLNHKDCPHQQCSLGDVVTDAMLDLYSNRLKDKNTFDAIAVINVGGLRFTIEEGDITLKDLKLAVPFGNTIDIGEIQGKHIKYLFESTTLPATMHCAASRLLQVSGVKVIYNLTNPEGDRAISIKVLSQNSPGGVFENLDLNRTYNIILPSFLTMGGDKVNIIPENIKNVIVGPTDIDVLKDYIEEKSPILKTEYDRLIFYR